MLIGASSCAQLQLISVRQCCQCFLLSTSPEGERACVCVERGRPGQAGEDDERTHTYRT